MKNLTMKHVIEQTNLNESLLRAVVKQHSNWHHFKECADDIASYGCVAGVSGFCYYHETTTFWKRNKAAIIETFEVMADPYETDVFNMILGLNGIDNAGLDDDEANPYFISKLMNLYNDNYSQFYNLLVWAAVEHVAYEVNNIIEDME